MLEPLFPLQVLRYSFSYEMLLTMPVQQEEVRKENEPFFFAVVPIFAYFMEHLLLFMS